MATPRRRPRLTGKASVVLLAVLGAVLVVVSAGRTWVTGTVDDVVLGAASKVDGTGSEVASGVVALALACGAAALVTATSGRVVRRVTVVLLGLATLGLGAYVVRVLLDPSGALGGVAARDTGRTGTIETSAQATVWPWVALLAVVLLAVATAAASVGVRRWAGLSARYDAPDGGGPAEPTASGSRGERVASDWERLSAGEDPTHEADAPAADTDQRPDRPPAS